MIPDGVVMNTMIDGLSRGGLLKEAYDLFVEMEMKGCQADELTFNLIIRGFIRENKEEEVMLLLRSMRSRGFFLKESTGPMLRVLFSSDELDAESLKFIHEVLDKTETTASLSLDGD